MDGSRRKADDRTLARRRDDREELAGRIAALLPSDGTVSLAPGLHLYRVDAPTDPIHGVYEPAFCVIAQGAKEVTLGDETLRYDPAHYLLASLDLPIVSRIVDASPARPYLGLRLELDRALVGAVLLDADSPDATADSNAKALDVSPLDAGLLDAVLRLVRLVETPDARRVLGPLVEREIVYRLLTGVQGARLRRIASPGGSAHRVAAAVELLRKNLDRPLRIESLARELGMSPSGFHHHFKAVTAMSPLQFLKQLRLQEARRLMLSEGLDAAHAGFRVGYEDAAHFNRDYKRLFGEPPVRDVRRLRRSDRATAEA